MPAPILVVAALFFVFLHKTSAFLPHRSQCPRVPKPPGNSCCWASTAKDLEFRAPKAADIEPISDLLVECFESELKWFEFPERENRRKRYRDMLQSFFLRRVEGKDKYSFMLMVESAQENNKIVGFVQVGSLPPPLGLVHGDSEEEEEAEAATVATRTTPIKQDVPYIANLCVLPSCRQGGIGKNMVDICIRWLDKKRDNNDTNIDNVFIAVDHDNFVAKRFYERIDFQWIEPPGSPTVVAKRDYYFKPIARNS